jgi:hypothetical protein
MEMDPARYISSPGGCLAGRAFQFMTPGYKVGVHVVQAELADEKDSVSAVLFRIRRCVPSIDLPTTELDALDLACRTRNLPGFLHRYFNAGLHREKSLSPLCFRFLLRFVERRRSSLVGSVLDVSAAASVRMPPYGLPFDSLVSLP